MLLCCIWLSGGGLHWSILQQRAVIHSSTSVQKLPEHGGPRAHLRSAGLQVCRNHHIFLECMVGFETPVETRRVMDGLHQQSRRLKEHTDVQASLVYGFIKKLMFKLKVKKYVWSSFISLKGSFETEATEKRFNGFKDKDCDEEKSALTCKNKPPQLGP